MKPVFVNGAWTVPVKPTARERARRWLDSEMGQGSERPWEDTLAEEIEAAAQAAREERDREWRAGFAAEFDGRRIEPHPDLSPKNVPRIFADLATLAEGREQAAREEELAKYHQAWELMECGHKTCEAYTKDDGYTTGCESCDREQRIREEERALGPCGKHPRACLDLTVSETQWRDGSLGKRLARENAPCLACAREARAVEEARIKRDNEWFERDPSFARAIGAMGAEFGWDGQGKVTEWLWLKLKRTRQIEQRIAEAEARVRRECAEIARRNKKVPGLPTTDPWNVASDFIAAAIERG